ncbi:uncharacterized protein [Miscanthus floridulus]|uniref:uncharacterized protein n=1 Tax=Miscanthus floridulus TaxID=154761 RepID=UPI003457629C
MINPKNTLKFVCPNKHEVYSMAKCRFKEWLYGPKNQWPEEPRRVKEKKKEMSTRKCSWECYDGQAKFLDELKKRQLIAQKRGYGPDYVNLFVKHHKEKMREFAGQRGICNPIDVGLNKWGLERRMTLEEERARNEAREETRVQMQVLNEHVATLCARIGCSGEHAVEVARARYEEKKLDGHRSRAGRSVQPPIVLCDEGDENEDDTGRLSELIALAEAGI